MKINFLLLVILIIVLIPFVALSHPGSLDENGGHWNRKNGEYHFHEGKNTTGSSSYDPDYKYPYVDFDPPYEPPIKESNNSSNYTLFNKDEFEASEVIPVCVGVIILLWLTITCSLEIKSARKNLKSTYVLLTIFFTGMLVTISYIHPSISIPTLLCCFFIAIIIFIIYKYKSKKTKL